MKAALWTLLAATALTVLCFDPLWRGGGFVGGDVYSYYFPQKSFFADSLRRGEFPLWNPLAAHGYPVLGESQTGAFYPPNLVLYRLLDVNAAYHAGQLLHYVLAFAFTTLLARRFGLGVFAAGLAGVVYVYGWFPARSCWEWAILGGAWLPLAVWLADRVATSARPRDALALAGVLAVQMLAGHEHLAFLTQLLVVGWATFRTIVPAANTDAPEPAVSRRTALLLTVSALLGGFALGAAQLVPMVELMRHSQRAELGDAHEPARGLLPWRHLTMLAGWVRAEEKTDAGDVTTWQPWCSPAIDQTAVLERGSTVPTNKTEAGLFFGIVPLGLALVGAVRSIRARNRVGIAWTVIGLLATLYATGLFMPVAKGLPGFGWFHGPGRFGLITTLAAGLLAGIGFDSLTRGDTSRSSTRSRWCALAFAGVVIAFAFLTIAAVSSAVEQQIQQTKAPSPLALFGRPVSDDAVVTALALLIVGTILSIALLGRDDATSERRRGAGLFGIVVLVTTLLELWMAGRLLVYSPMVADPPINHRNESPVRQALFNDPIHTVASVRLQAPGGNLPSILGVASTPAYFTFGPREYVRQDHLPELVAGPPRAEVAARARVEWARYGVTHVLSFVKLDAAGWGLEPVWSGIDPFLNPAWGMFREPIHLYRVSDMPGRARFLKADDTAPRVGSGGGGGGERKLVTIAESADNRVVLEVEAPAAGRVVLTDLHFPGWTVEVDGRSAEAIRHDGMFRAVDVPPGRHTIIWNYQPASVRLGGAISLVGLATWATALGFALRSRVAARP